MSFKVGDRVEFVGPGYENFGIIPGNTGDVISLEGSLVGIEFDEEINGHSCLGAGRVGYCLWILETRLEYTIALFSSSPFSPYEDVLI